MTCRTFLSVKPGDSWRTSSQDLSLGSIEKDSKFEVGRNVSQAPVFHLDGLCVFMICSCSSMSMKRASLF